MRGCAGVTPLKTFRTLFGLDDVDKRDDPKSIESGAVPPRRGEVHAQHYPQSLIIESDFGGTSGRAGGRPSMST